MADRIEYRKGKLDESQVSPNPFEQFAHWMEEAIAAKIVEPTAMCLSTVGPDLRPSSRIVLLRGQDDSEFVFFSNYLSRKGLEINENPFGCLTFWWATLERQIRIEGVIEQVDERVSDEYWAGRPFESQVVSAASPQSQVVQCRDALEDLVNQVRSTHSDNIPRPSHWGGYRFKPDRFEFWQGGPSRLHDRLCYLLEGGLWKIARLAP